MVRYMAADVFEKGAARMIDSVVSLRERHERAARILSHTESRGQGSVTTI